MISKNYFGTTDDGSIVSAYAMTSSTGCSVTVLDYGVTIQSLLVPDRNGALVDVVLGYDTLDEYVANNGSMGAVIGRFANRIGAGKFSLNGTDYRLCINNRGNHIHGGFQGFDRRIWNCDILEEGLRFWRLSPDGEEGYPGNLTVAVELRWINGQTLELLYHGQTDQDTIVNLTNHSYFNLSGTGNILAHELQICADSYTPTNETRLPTGEILPVAGTVLDFLVAHPVGDFIDRDAAEVAASHGYDHNYVLSGSPAAEVWSPVSGITMTVETDQPGLQLYTANFLSERTGKDGTVYRERSGLCLETQHYPDCINHPEWPSCVLRQSEKFFNRTTFSFSVRKQ